MPTFNWNVDKRANIVPCKNSTYSGILLSQLDTNMYKKQAFFLIIKLFDEENSSTCDLLY